MNSPFRCENKTFKSLMRKPTIDDTHLELTDKLEPLAFKTEQVTSDYTVRATNWKFILQ